MPTSSVPSGLISFVLPVFNEAGTLPEFHRRLLDALGSSGLPYDWEFLYIDDGSADYSVEAIEAIAGLDPRVRLLRLSRNFGHQVAVTAGLDHAAGDAVVIMDTDLQDPPAIAVQLIERWREGFDVVYAQRNSRRDGLFKRASAAAFYRLLARVAEIDIPRDTGDFRLLSRQVADALRRFPEHGRFLRGMTAWAGFRQTAVRFDRDERYAGTSGYPLKKMITLAGDGIFSFSTVPLKLVSATGWLIASLALLGIVYVGIRGLLAPASVVPGWTWTIIAILGVGGVQILMLSVLGSYLGRVYREVQARPLYLLAEPHRDRRGAAVPVPHRAARRD